jgi:hypothetical protein
MRAPLIAIGAALAAAGAAPAAAQASISISGPETTPESGTLTYTVSRSSLAPLLNPDATVTVSTVNGTAAAPGDVAAKSETVTLAPSLFGTSQTFTVTVAPDTLDEPDETFTVALSDEQGDTLAAPTSVKTTIVDDDAPPTVTLGTPATAPEGTGTDGPGLVFPVTLSGPSGKSISVGYASRDGTASSAQDYTAKSGTVAFPPGATSTTVTVPVVPDAVDEDDETAALTLSAPANAILGATTTATGTIADDDTATLSIAGAMVPEGAAGTTSVATAQIDLSLVSDRPVTVTYATVDGTATAPEDYTATTGQVTIPAGQRFATVPVTVIGDAKPEAAEVLGVRISDPVGAPIAQGGDLAPVVLSNDDGAVLSPTPTPAPATPGTPAGGGTPSTTGGGTASQPVRLAKPTYTRAGGRLRYKVSCPAGGGSCRVGLTVFTVPAAKSPVKALRREQQLATKSLSVPAGTTVTFELRLSTRARGWLRTAKRIRTNAYAVSKDATGAYSTARVSATLSR